MDQDDQDRDRDDAGGKPGGGGAPSRIDHADPDASHGAETNAAADPHPDSDRPTGQAGTGQSGGGAPTSGR